ncbi:uncharacterized protein KY384_003534 [Bacidia gigantensis]|uniref:uncharacterized protein n=1 Tax=Bacidia gigantensis TaxID=2732470 RepID=UPI001D048796|nr:uncharacterized protein KY384_003534 [Bacidia gigantensis]KAG8531898.1 hypothetical protein KY384_003534 [Bacidia gigantensis]
MDPFSATASVLAILGAVGKIAKGLRKVLGLRHAPSVLLALNNEISDLQLVVSDVHDILRTVEEHQIAPLKSTVNALERVKSTLLGLEKFVVYGLTTVSKDDSFQKVDKIAWAQLEHRFSTYKDNLRENKAALAASISLLVLCVENAPYQFQRSNDPQSPHTDWQHHRNRPCPESSDSEDPIKPFIPPNPCLEIILPPSSSLSTPAYIVAIVTATV